MTILHQPKAVWAVAFACVIAFMGIGLVDPILPALAQQFDAGPSQVEMLFTSYFAIIAISMLITGWISSRIGAKRTLLAGLALAALTLGWPLAATISGRIYLRIGFRSTILIGIGVIFVWPPRPRPCAPPPAFGSGSSAATKL